MLGIVAHDLRTPLHTVRLQTQLLRLHGAESASLSRRAADTIERATIFTMPIASIMQAHTAASMPSPPP